jgi:hypothetical protein
VHTNTFTIIRKTPVVAAPASTPVAAPPPVVATPAVTTENTDAAESGGDTIADRIPLD